jgi:hypothetical protein
MSLTAVFGVGEVLREAAKVMVGFVSCRRCCQ